MKLLTIDEIAEILLLSRNHVRDKIVKDAGFPRPALNLSKKSRRWAADDVIGWIEKQRAMIAR